LDLHSPEQLTRGLKIRNSTRVLTKSAKGPKVGMHEVWRAITNRKELNLTLQLLVLSLFVLVLKTQSAICYFFG
jgi:hypothetical protein